MAARKRTVKPSAKTAPKAEKPIELTAEFSPDRRLSVSVGTSGDYGKAKVNLMFSQNIQEGEDHLKVVDELFEPLSDKLIEKYEELCDKLGLDEEIPEEEEFEEEVPEEADEADEDPEEEEEWDEEEGEEDDDEEELTEDDIMKMSKKDLVALIKEEELEEEIDIKLKLKDLREAVVEAMFEEEEEGEEDDDEEWDDEEWDDDDDS